MEERPEKGDGSKGYLQLTDLRFTILTEIKSQAPKFH
jgi:hypothetical protein